MEFKELLVSKLKKEGLKIENDPIVEEIDEVINDVKFVYKFDVEIKRTDRNKKLIFKMDKTCGKIMFYISYYFKNQWVKNAHDFFITPQEFWVMFKDILIVLKDTVFEKLPTK